MIVCQSVFTPCKYTRRSLRFFWRQSHEVAIYVPKIVLIVLKGRQVSAFEFKSSSTADPFLWEYVLPAPTSDKVAQLLGLFKGVLLHQPIRVLPQLCNHIPGNEFLKD